MSIFFRCFFVALFLSASLRAVAGDQAIVRHDHRVHDVYIVIFEKGVSSPRSVAHDLARQHGGRVRAAFDNLPLMVLGGPEAIAERVARDPRVKLVEEAPEGDLMQVTAPVDPPGWARDRINERQLPLDSNGSFSGQKGLGAMIYIVDSGINDATLIEFGSRLRHLWSFNSSFNDNLGHGTAVAALAGGRTYGVATSAEIVNVKIMEQTRVNLAENFLSAVSQINADFLAQNPENASGLRPYTKPAVVNASLAFDASPGIDTAVVESMRLGIAWVVAAGNGRQNSSGLWTRQDASTFSPARLGKPDVQGMAHTVTVGATSLESPWDQDQIAHIPEVMSSSTGADIDIWAPGYRVSTIGRYGDPEVRSGTSMAAPQVAGALARHTYADLGFAIDEKIYPAKWEANLVSFATKRVFKEKVAVNVLRDPVTGSLDLGSTVNNMLFLFGGVNDCGPSDPLNRPCH